MQFTTVKLLRVLAQCWALWGLLYAAPLLGQPPTSRPLPPSDPDTLKVNILFSESLKGIQEGGILRRTLVGNVQLQQKDVKMRCDSAVIINNDVKAYGNIVITQADTVQIFADSAYYFGDIRQVTLLQDVVLSDGNAQLFTPTLDYDLNTRVAVYQQGAILQNRDTRLSSQRGYYYTRLNQAYFGGDVVVADPEFSLEADTLNINTATNVTTFLGPTDILTRNQEQIYCESGYYDPTAKRASFRTRPRFKSDNGLARALAIDYNGQREEVTLAGEARFKNATQNVAADTITYNTRSKQFGTAGPTLITEPGRSIVAASSFYDDSTSTAVFVGAVCISDSTRIICADSIRYQEELRQGYAYGNVVSRDTAENITLTGAFLAYNDSLKTALAHGNPLLWTLLDGDTLYLAADTLRSFTRDTIPTDSSQQVTLAYRDVRVFSSDFQAVCDSLVYDREEQQITFLQSPYLWSDTSQFSGDTIVAYLVDDKLHEAHILQRAFLLNSPDEVYFNQVKGRTIIAYFDNDTLQRMRVQGNGEALYYILDDARAYIGANKTVCARMLIEFQHNEVQDIYFYTQPQGEIVPMRKITSPDALQFEGFRWNVGARPLSPDDLHRGRSAGSPPPAFGESPAQLLPEKTTTDE